MNAVPIGSNLEDDGDISIMLLMEGIVLAHSIYPKVRRRLLIGIVIVVIVAAMVAFYSSFKTDKAVSEEYTYPGEMITCTLPDGGIANLDTNTRLLIQYNDQLRKIVLLSGRAYFKVNDSNQNEKRPFVVMAKNTQTSGQKGEFVVDILDDGINVFAMTDKLTVYTPQKQYPLQKGQAVLLNSKNEGQLERNEPDDFLWRSGQIVIDDMTLIQTIDVLNKYRHKPLALFDPTMNNVRINKVFRIDKLDQEIEHTIKALGLKIHHYPSYDILL